MVAGLRPATAVRHGVEPGAGTHLSTRSGCDCMRGDRRITVQPLLNWDAVVDVSLLNRSLGAAICTRMLFQLRHFRVAALRPRASLPANTYDRHNVSTLIDERNPAALPARLATQEFGSVVLAGSARLNSRVG